MTNEIVGMEPGLLIWCFFFILYRAPDKVHIFISKISISSPNLMFDHLLESSHRDDSNKWSNIGFGEEITRVEAIEVHFTHLFWFSAVMPIFSPNLMFDHLLVSSRRDDSNNIDMTLPK